MNLSLFLGGIILLLSAGVAVIIFFLLFKAVRAERTAMRAKAREESLLAKNEALFRIGKMRAEFFQNMSHDFKTPLTVISTCMMNMDDLLEMEKMDLREMKECVANAQRETLRLSRMLDSAMKLSSIEDNKQKLEVLDVAGALRDGAEAYRVFMRRNGNSLVLNVPKALPPIECSVDMLLHVVANILSNANRHTKNGKIYFSATAKDETVHISVIDNGNGIPPELLPFIFERGVSETGSGLGLSICKTVIEEIHKGNISIDSKYGFGTQVMIEIPIKKGAVEDD